MGAPYARKSHGSCIRYKLPERYLGDARAHVPLASASYPLPCGRNSWLRSVGSRLTGDFSGAHHSLFYYWGSNLRSHSRFHHGNAEQYWDGSILSTTPQCFSYYDYPSRLVIESSAGHDYEVRDSGHGSICRRAVEACNNSWRHPPLQMLGTKIE